MARAMKKATGLKADIIASATGKGSEPQFTPLNQPSKIELARALSFYNSNNFKPDDYKKWAIAWIGKNRPDILEVAEGHKPFRFQTFGALMRMQTRGLEWDANVKNRVNVFLDSLRVAENDDEVDEDGIPAPKKRRVKSNPNNQAFDDELDNVMKGWNPKSGIAFEIDASQDVSGIIKRAEDMLDTFKEEGVQQYPLHMKVWLKAVLAKLSGIQKIVKVRKPRKARVRKVNPIKMTSKVKFLKSDAALKIDSKSPTDIIGKQKVYLFDTKYKKLTKLVCAEGTGFLIKGTTIQNFDPAKSSVAFIRKPQSELKQGMGVREIDRVMNSSKSKRQAEPKGRINEHTLILNTI